MKPQTLVSLYRTILEQPALSQRELAEHCGFSVGTVNRALQYAVEHAHLETLGKGHRLTQRGLSFLQDYKVDNAIILAAGFGSRFVPLTYETPKGLLKVKGQPMLERQIEQLKEQGIEEIILVVGYMKEAFDYLVDLYGVKLIYNPEYATKNNLASLYHAKDYLKNSYILVADNWIINSIFHRFEPDSWFSCPYFKGPTAEWCVQTTPSGKITKIEIGGHDSLAVVGPAYFSASFSQKFRHYLTEYYQKKGTDDYYWEQILKDHIADLPMYANVQTDNVLEFESLAELRTYDHSYIDKTQSKIMQYIARQHEVPEGEIVDIAPLKDGVTNQSFKFTVRDQSYVFRLPGYGTDKLIDRMNEKHVYEMIGPLDLSDEIVSFDADSGIKITKFYANARIADPFNNDDLALSMQKIKQVHDQKIHVDHSFDIASMIEYYYSLAEGIDAIRFQDIDGVRQELEELLSFRRALGIEEVLCHGDYAHTNVLHLEDGQVRLIDWEYSGTADPIMDVSMYAIYAEFDRARIDLSLDLYLGRQPNNQEKARLYLYVALGGFLWSMWSSYKQGLGQEFGEYPMKMYRYMKDYYKILHENEYIVDLLNNNN